MSSDNGNIGTAVLRFKTIDTIGLNGAVRAKVRRYAICENSTADQGRLDLFMNDIMDQSDRCIIVPRTGHQEYLIADVKTLFRNYILEPFLRTGQRSIYRMRRGIRQGGPLSSDLCSIYIDDMLDNVLDNFGFAADEWRIIHEDDMCFLTGSLSRAQYYLDRMVKDFPSYGLQVNRRKLQLNFKPNCDLSEGGDDVQLTDYFLYYGRAIYPNHPTRVQFNYEAYLAKTIQYTFLCDPFLDKDTIKRNIVGKYQYWAM